MEVVDSKPSLDATGCSRRRARGGRHGPAARGWRQESSPRIVGLAKQNVDFHLLTKPEESIEGARVPLDLIQKDAAGTCFAVTRWNTVTAAADYVDFDIPHGTAGDGPMDHIRLLMNCGAAQWCGRVPEILRMNKLLTPFCHLHLFHPDLEGAIRLKTKVYQISHGQAGHGRIVCRCCHLCHITTPYCIRLQEGREVKSWSRGTQEAGL